MPCGSWAKATWVSSNQKSRVLISLMWVLARGTESRHWMVVETQGLLGSHIRAIHLLIALWLLSRPRAYITDWCQFKVPQVA